MSGELGSLNKDLLICPKDGREMVLLVRRIIREWVNAELPYPIDDLDVLIGIESESDHLLGSKIRPVFGSSPTSAVSDMEEEKELADLYGFFLQRYELARSRLIKRLNEPN